VPIYTLRRDLRTVSAIWQEYDEGLDGHPSVRSLESRYGARWRRMVKERVFFGRRNVFYEAV
ncbi:transcriptional activator of glycolytic enzymes-domain-containing protein, partial [Blyttiomyces helicus]